ncbi:regulatory protein TetR [Actinobacteria bacterium OK074]|nr:regulatory protein TetR [Actinobacteria bacterium OK074]
MRDNASQACTCFAYGNGRGYDHRMTEAARTWMDGDMKGAGVGARAGGTGAGAGAVTSTRDIARAAVRARLVEVALDLFRREGFDQVTVNKVSAAAGVSRSTFLRYFASKEDAILLAFDTQDEQAADAVRSWPPAEDEWAALRHAMRLNLGPFRQAPEDVLPLARLLEETPALAAGRREKQVRWRDALARALAERAGEPASAVPPVRTLVRAAAAVECLNIAVEQWTRSEGRADLDALLDRAFEALRGE